jgi:ribulose 1,5-bisphosphate synthetase/thiazole synthase
MGIPFVNIIFHRVFASEPLMIKLPEEIEVLLIGGGTAGLGAVVAAGRQDLNVIMLEATSKVGGVMAFCPGMPWGGGYPVDQIIGGLIEDLTVRLKGISINTINGQ